MSAADRAAAVAVGDDATAWALSVGDDDWARAAGGVAWAFGIPLPRLAGSEAALEGSNKVIFIRHLGSQRVTLVYD